MDRITTYCLVPFVGNATLSNIGSFVLAESRVVADTGYVNIGEVGKFLLRECHFFGLR